MEFEHMSPAEIQQHLAAIEQQRVSALHALNQAKEQAKQDLAEVIKDMITDAVIPWTISSTRPLKGAAPPAAVKRFRNPRWSPPPPLRAPTMSTRKCRQCLCQGRDTGLMKQKMLSQGLDPKSKTDRNSFKADWPQRLADSSRPHGRGAYKD